MEVAFKLLDINRKRKIRDFKGRGIGMRTALDVFRNKKGGITLVGEAYDKHIYKATEQLTSFIIDAVNSGNSLLPIDSDTTGCLYGKMTMEHPYMQLLSMGFEPENPTDNIYVIQKLQMKSALEILYFVYCDSNKTLRSFAYSPGYYGREIPLIQAFKFYDPNRDFMNWLLINGYVKKGGFSSTE